jgi:hypothetical protein
MVQRLFCFVHVHFRLSSGKHIRGGKRSTNFRRSHGLLFWPGCRVPEDLPIVGLRSEFCHFSKRQENPPAFQGEHFVSRRNSPRFEISGLLPNCSRISDHHPLRCPHRFPRLNGKTKTLISITAQRRVLPKALNQLALISPDVVGPVAAFWDQRLAIQDTDQVSFHTDDAIKLIGEHLKGVEKC